jgi:cbb3-type cytochrome oxidase subunit 3
MDYIISWLEEQVLISRWLLIEIFLFNLLLIVFIFRLNKKKNLRDAQKEDSQADKDRHARENFEKFLKSWKRFKGLIINLIRLQEEMDTEVKDYKNREYKEVRENLLKNYYKCQDIYETFLPKEPLSIGGRSYAKPLDKLLGHESLKELFSNTNIIVTKKLIMAVNDTFIKYEVSIS